MSGWTEQSIARSAGGSWIIRPDSGSIAFAGVSINSRELQSDQGFVAFVGVHTDGHRYLQHAADAGASFCIITDPEAVPEGFTTPTLLVDDPLSSLTGLARAWRDRLSACVIAITGSNGKTTTCRIMHAIASKSGRSSVSMKSFNNALGVPITILNTPLDADYLIAEVGTSTPGEIAERTKLLRPDLCIITSVGSAHLEALGSLDGVAREKADLIRRAPPEAVGVYHDGNELLDSALHDDPHRCLVLGREQRFEVTETTLGHTGFRIDEDRFNVIMPGEHSAFNAGLCVLAARSLGLSDQHIRDGLGAVTPPPMRFERTSIETATQPIVVINDAYNANPDSMRASLRTFAGIDLPEPRVAVLAEMLELGQSASSAHAELAEFAKTLPGIGRVIFLGGLYPEPDAESIKSLADLIEPGQSVLLKGSRGVGLERLIPLLRNKHGSNRSIRQENPSGRA